MGIRGSEDYRKWVREEAFKIHSDGCSHALQIHRECCYEHDLGYYYGRDPRVAFQFGWESSPQVTRREIDSRFRECHPFGVRVWRWMGVRLGGRGIWNRHRAVRP